MVGILSLVKSTFGSSPEPEDPLSLVRRAVAGDARAVRALVTRLTPVIQARAARALLRRGRGLSRRDVRQEVEDLVQTVFAALFENGGKLLFDWDPSRGKSFHNYVALVADSRLASLLRTQRGRVWPDDPMDDEALEASAEVLIGPEPVIHSREELDLVMRRFREVVSDRGHELFVMLYVEERSAEEVSRLSGLSVENVHAHKSRLGKLARRVAAEVLSEDGDCQSGTIARARPQGKEARR